MLRVQGLGTKDFYKGKLVKKIGKCGDYGEPVKYL